MVCTRPLAAWWGPARTIVFTPSDGYSDRPLSLPCSRCPGCRKRRVQMWAQRCLHELTVHERSSFVTLTYSPQQLPSSGVSKDDWQLFAKRVRSSAGPFRFFMCGEYGGLTYRPHYHALMFGIDFSADRVEINHKNASKYKLFKSPSLDALWSKGNCVIGEVSFESAAYVAGYILKAADVEYVNEDTGEVMNPPFQLMSRRPGLGAAWFEKFHGDVFPSDELISSSGKPMGVPSYYDKLLSRRNPEGFLSVKARRARRASEAKPRNLHARELIDNAKDNVRGL